MPMNKKRVAIILGVIAVVLILMIIQPGKPPEQVFPQFLFDPLKLTDSSVNDEDPSLLKAQDGTLYLVWYSDQGGAADLWLTRSKETFSWSKPQPIITQPTGDFYPTLIQAQDNTFHLSWFGIDPKTRNADIYYSNSNDAINWSDPIQITTSPAIDWVPSLMQDNKGVLRIVWSSDRIGNKEIFLVSSDDNGNTWTDPKQITHTKSADDYPFLAQQDDGTYLLTWTRYTPQGEPAFATNPTSEIVLSTSNDTLNWSSPIVISSEDQKHKVTDTYPIIYKHNKKYFVSWTSNRIDAFGNIVARSLSNETIITLTKSKKADYTGKIVSLNETTIAMTWVSNRENNNNDIFFREFFFE